MAAIALSIYESSATTGELLSKLIHIAKEARKLKRECEGVRQHAIIMQHILNINQRLRTDDDCEKRLRNVVTQLLDFVAWCKDANFFQRAWQVTWEKRLPGLERELTTCALLFISENTASSRSEISGLISGTNRIEQRQQEDASELKSQIRGLSTILDEQMSIMRQEDVPELRVDFPEDDPRLKLNTEARDDALLSGELFPYEPENSPVKVVGEPVNESVMKYGEKGPRHVLIYAQISANAGVHPFYGIAKRFGKRWTVMKDLRGTPTVAQAIKNGTWPEPLALRLSVAYEVAKTMEYLHSVEILVKRLSDHTVVLEETDDTITPYLTNLESARLFKERTTGGRYDLRFGAPEVTAMTKGQHTVYSDIWSLGIFILQCATGTPPFNIASEVLEESAPDALKIHGWVSEGLLPWSRGEQGLAPMRDIIHLVKQCCNSRPTIRPSATEVVHTLFEIMTMQPQDSNVISSTDTEAAKERAADVLKPERTGVKLSEQDHSSLRRLADEGDATAAYLLGSAIWKKRADPDDEVTFAPIVRSEKHRETDIRARVALELLEFAFQSGVKQAVGDLAEIHVWLGQLYKTRFDQARGLKFI